MEPGTRPHGSASPGSTPRSRRLAGWLDVFAVDVRSLAALRIVLALTVLVDLGMRASSLRVHYSDEGVLPRQVLLEHLDPWLMSVALSNGTPFFQGLLFIMAAAFLLLGGARGLIVLGLPPHLAYLAIGAASALAGFVTLKGGTQAPGRANGGR